LAQIELRDIRKVYALEDTQIVAVEEVSISFQRGESVSIVGHSGSGKTTLLSILGGILSPTSGSVLFNGTDIFGLADEVLAEYRAEKIGYVFQFASLLPVLTAKENLLLPNLFRGGNGRGCDEKKAVEYLRMVGLGDKLNAYPSQLSGGQQRRVAIARALMNDPELILADEPTGDLDEETEAEVMGFFRRINREHEITFVLVTHSTELASFSDRKFRMTHGRVEELA
jgi:putative ABC transport system ATP-binding protein/lipoprotein-releasing system ATP-binding protein